MMIMPIMAVSDQRLPQQTSQAKLSARRKLVQSVKEGMTAQEARRRCPVRMHRTTAYRLLKCVEREGEQALVEWRHGHPTKLCGEVLTFLLDYCQSHAFATSREIQCCVSERFDLSVSISQLSRVRAAHEL